MIRRVMVAAAIAATVVSTAACSNPAAVAGHPAPAYAACTQEDGSSPGQAFPCMWDASTQGNGQGTSFVLVMPQCTVYESTLSALAESHGYVLRLACDNSEDPASVIGAN